ncbi:hypothetical protein FRC03_012618 [Tulasnella sp. 419]|nr:hypothetical protein FRC03_012618 [Tulasnella sp. 419]
MLFTPSRFLAVSALALSVAAQSTESFPEVLPSSRGTATRSVTLEPASSSGIVTIQTDTSLDPTGTALSTTRSTTRISTTRPTLLPPTTTVSVPFVTTTPPTLSTRQVPPTTTATPTFATGGAAARTAGAGIAAVVIGVVGAIAGLY